MNPIQPGTDGRKPEAWPPRISLRVYEHGRVEAHEFGHVYMSTAEHEHIVEELRGERVVEITKGRYGHEAFSGFAWGSA